MAQTSFKEQIKKQEESISSARKKIAALKEKSEAKQKANLLKAADRTGFYSIEISLDDLENALRNIIESANSPQEQISQTQVELENA